MKNINILKRLKFLPAIAVLAMPTFIAAQYLPKFDRTFQTMYNAQKEGRVSDPVSKMAGIKDVNPAASKENGEVYYSAIIYAKDTKALKAAGINVQSVLPKFVTALVTLNDLDKLANMPTVTHVKVPRMLYPTNDIAVAQSGASLLQAGVLNNTVYKGKGVLVGIFDSGNYFKHPDFRDPVDQNKSRILKMWDQTITPKGSELSPSGFTYGVEYTQQQINDELSGATTGAVREADTNGHGTHVAGTAAGNGMALSSRKYTGMAPEASYIIVKGGDGGFSSANIINGLTYFNTVATELKMPIVVNMSLGGQYSAHDGTGDEEDAVNLFTSTPGRVVAIAAGNDNSTNIHKQTVIPAGGTGTISFNVPSNTSASDLFAFLLYSKDANDLSATIIDPSGNVASLLADSSTPDSGIDLGTGFTFYGDNYIDENNNNRFIDTYVQRKSGSRTNARGVWTLTIKNNGTTETTTDGWIYYRNTAFTTANLTITGGDSNYLIGSPGDAKSAITVASYTGKLQWFSNNTGNSGGYSYTATTKQTDALSDFSSYGPLRDGTQKPDIAATGEAIISALAAGSIKTSDANNVDGTYYQVMSGTSMATPATAGAIALILQAKPTATAAEVKSLLTSTASKDNATTASLPNAQWGYGKLDVFQAVSKLTGSNKTRKTYINETYPYLRTSDAGVGLTTQKLAESFTPDISGYLGGVSFAISTLSNVDSYTIEVWSSNAGAPDTLLESKTVDASTIGKFNWNYVDLSDLKVPVKQGQDYVIVLYTSGASPQWSIIYQAANTDNRSMISKDNGATWAPDTRGYRIRSVVYSDSDAVLNADNIVKKGEVSVYPNPAVDMLKVRLPKNEKSTLKIYDMSGKLVKSLDANSDNIEINVIGFQKGVYLLSIETPTQKTTKKFMKN